MKKRIITSVIGVIVILPCFIFMHSPLFALLFSAAGAIAVHEIIKATGGKNKILTAISCLTAAAIPLLMHYNIEIPVMPVIIIYILAYLMIMVLMYKKTPFNHVVTALFATIAIPCSFSMGILLRDIYIRYPYTYTKATGVFFIFLAVFSAWMTDTFAYFVGRKFGKHKLCPKISPKKTVEGALGGSVGEVILNTALFFVFDKFFFTVHTIEWWQIVIISVILSVVSMFGDLSASVIKRNHGVKDFGKLLPGHGGIMDRADSLLFVLPTLFAAVYLINI